jgi:cytochrome bd ubiquinol oxidase subunit II
VTTLWFILLAFMLTMYVLLDGFDLGAGAIHLFVARNDRERRTVLRAIGPVWDGNEVWLIAAGGTLFFAFPLLYAASFSGFYLPLFMVLWLLMIRGIAIELRSHFEHPIWASFWDGMFFIGSALLAVFLGAALANVMRGVPLDSHGSFFEPLWTNFDPRSATPGILDWYTVMIGLLALILLTMHGANFVALKTEGVVNDRARRAARALWIPALVLTIVSTIATHWIRPGLLDAFNARPLGYVFPLCALAGLLAMGYGYAKGWEQRAFAASSATIAGLLASTAFSLYPNVLPAVNPANSLTISNASSSNYGLTVGLVWWLIGIGLAVTYVAVTYHLFRGKIRLDGSASGGGY